MYSYVLLIDINKAQFNKKRILEFPYYKKPDGTVFYDTVTYKGNTIRIMYKRSRKPSEEVLSSVNSTQYKTLMKSLLFAYFAKGSFSVQRLTVSFDGYKHDIDIHRQSFSKQPFIGTLPEESLMGLTRSLENSELVMIALMNYALASRYEELRFDYLWRCFNSLARATSGESQDYAMLQRIRESIEKNPGDYSRVLAFAKDVTVEQLSQRRLASMINNNFAKGCKNEAQRVEEFCESFSDSRVSGVLYERIVCKKKPLTQAGRYDAVLKTLKSITEKKEKKDSDVVRLLILKYAYFLRCKYFHAEKWPAHCLIETQSSSELEYVSKPLAMMCLDLIEGMQKQA